jgi:arylsulfatase A-like enzyme
VINRDDPPAINAYKWNYRRMTDAQKQAWDTVYDPIADNFKKTNPQGDELLRWKFQRYMNDYLACIASVDDNVGRLLDYLEESGLAGNTIVVYTSDQGFYMGEHGWFDKRFMYEESLRTPLIIRWPGKTRAGTVCNAMVLNLDFAETFLDAAGADIPEGMQGVSLLPLLAGKGPATWRDAIYYHYYEYPAVHSVKRHYGIRTERYKLIHFYYNIDEWELYDLQEDPQEMTNIYGQPGTEEITRDLKEQLEQLRARYGDSDELTRSFLPVQQ